MHNMAAVGIPADIPADAHTGAYIDLAIPAAEGAEEACYLDYNNNHAVPQDYIRELPPDYNNSEAVYIQAGVDVN